MARDRVFICYSSKDAKHRDDVVKHFAGLGEGAPLVYTDQSNELGGQWRKEVDEALASARVAVLLVSPDFLTSEFVTAVELPELLRAATAEGVLVVPVFV